MEASEILEEPLIIREETSGTRRVVLSELAKYDISLNDLLIHDEKASEPSLAYLLSRLRYEDGFPEPIGVFRAVDAPKYDEEMNRQIQLARETKGDGDLDALFTSGDTWTVA